MGQRAAATAGIMRALFLAWRSPRAFIGDWTKFIASRPRNLMQIPLGPASAASPQAPSRQARLSFGPSLVL